MGKASLYCEIRLVIISLIHTFEVWQSIVMRRHFCISLRTIQLDFSIQFMEQFDVSLTSFELMLYLTHIKTKRIIRQSLNSLYHQILMISPQQSEVKDNSQKKILVTVGTTQFEELIQFTDSNEFIHELQKMGFLEHNILYQIGGKGIYQPTHGTFITLSPNIQQIYQDHDIIFTHGGSGTLLACLAIKPQKHKQIIAVANNQLVGNHQIEIIKKLREEGYVLGYESVEQMKSNLKEVMEMLVKKDLHYNRDFQEQEECLLNKLVFGQ